MPQLVRKRGRRHHASMLGFIKVRQLLSGNTRQDSVIASSTVIRLHTLESVAAVSSLCIHRDDDDIGDAIEFILYPVTSLQCAHNGRPSGRDGAAERGDNHPPPH